MAISCSRDLTPGLLAHALGAHALVARRHRGEDPVQVFDDAPWHRRDLNDPRGHLGAEEPVPQISRKKTYHP